MIVTREEADALDMYREVTQQLFEEMVLDRREAPAELQGAMVLAMDQVGGPDGLLKIRINAATMDGAWNQQMAAALRDLATSLEQVDAPKVVH